MLELTDTSYVEMIWFVDMPGQGDFMAAVWRDADDAPWQAAYRFRYSDSRDPFDSNDRKSLYAMTLNPADGTTEAGRDRLVQAMRLAADMSSTRCGGAICELPIRGDAHACVAALKGQSWANYLLTAPGPTAPQ